MTLTNLLATAAIVLAGCATYDEHHIETAWTIDTLASGPVDCPGGWTTARLISVDPAQPDEQIVDTFPCSAGQGVSSYLPADSYTSWIEITNGDKTLARSPATTVPVTSFNPDLLADIYLDAGWAQLGWTSCPDHIELGLVAADGSQDMTLFPCGDGVDLAGPLAAGTYHASVAVGAWSVALPDVTIAAVNRVADLGTVTPE